MRTLVICLWFIGCFSISINAVEIDLGSSGGMVLAGTRPHLPPIPLTVTNADDLSTAELLIDFDSFQVTKIEPLHEGVQVEFEQSNELLSLNLTFDDQVPDDKQVLIHYEATTSNLPDEGNCFGFGFFEIVKVALLNHENETVIPKRLEGGLEAFNRH